MARKQSTGMMSGVRAGLTIQVEAPGLDEMIEKLQKFAKIGDTDAKRVRAGMNKTKNLVLGQAKETVPVRTGAMKATLFGKVKVWGEGNVTGNVGSNGSGLQFGPVVPFVLEGGRQPNARGRMAITPRRWLYHAYARVKDQVDTVWKEVLDQITRDLAAKG
jgi:hypothetical protein